jgi:hypothetical protein
MMAMILWIAVGAALMYFFDPMSGRERRAWLLDKMNQISKKVAGPASTTGANTTPSDRPADPQVGEVIEGRIAGGDTTEKRRDPEN